MYCPGAHEQHALITVGIDPPNLRPNKVSHPIYTCSKAACLVWMITSEAARHMRQLPMNSVLQTGLNHPSAAARVPAPKVKGLPQLEPLDSPHTAPFLRSCTPQKRRLYRMNDNSDSMAHKALGGLCVRRGFRSHRGAVV